MAGDGQFMLIGPEHFIIRLLESLKEACSLKGVEAVVFRASSQGLRNQRVLLRHGRIWAARKVETVVIRHPKERLSKCSLTPLHGRDEIQFYVAKKNFQLDATGYTLLAVDAPPLTPADRERPLLVLDATWKLLPAV